jgi:hypothetical protein
MRNEASLARLIQDHGDKWIIEHTGASTAWVAVRRDDLRIVGAHDIGGLSYSEYPARALFQRAAELVPDGSPDIESALNVRG